MLTYYLQSLHEAEEFVIRLLCYTSMNVCFTTPEELRQRLEHLKSNLSTCVFSHDTLYLSKHSKDDNALKFLKSLTIRESIAQIPVVRLLFEYQLDGDEHGPSMKLDTLQNSMHRLRLRIDLLCTLKRDISPEKVYEALCNGLKEFLSKNWDAVQTYWERNAIPRSVFCHHYHVGQNLVTIFYPNVFAEDKERAFRRMLHESLGLTDDCPKFRRGQAFHPVPYFCNWLGPNDLLLVCPHEELKPPSLAYGPVHIVRGRYTYKHYMQDNVDDKNWGCAYRSLQTLISWLMWQGEIAPGRLPTLTDIQSALVRVGDKPKTFVGSRQWIGSLEVSFCLQELYHVQCRILPVSRGADMATTAAPQLAQHFASGGGPVMIGGGQLAHTIIGVQLREDNLMLAGSTPRAARYLILDPHFTGPSGQLRTVLDKGWCGWKESNFWKPDVFYNLCFLPAIRPGC